MESFDLNLLRVFIAVWEEKSVTLAARRLSVTQPALSNMLRRLRDQLDDDLFVRIGSSMEPTSRAVQLAPAIQQHLGELLDSLKNAGSSFITNKRKIRVAISDYAAFLILPKWLPQIQKQNPTLRFVFRDLRGEDAELALTNGEVDWVLDIRLPKSETLFCTALMRDRYICILRKDHPLATETLTMSKFLTLDHLLVRTLHALRGRVDGALATQHKRRNVIASVDHFLLAPPLVSQTDWICTLESRLAKALTSQYSLVLKKPPLKLEELKLYSIWDKRTDNDHKMKSIRSSLALFCKQKFCP